MYTIVGLLIDGILIAVLVVPIIWIWQRTFHKELGAKHRWLAALFGCYIAEIFAVTGIPSVWRLNADLSVNLVPFDALHTSPIQYCLNIILFIPLGILAPLIWHKFGRLRMILLLGGGLSCFIEFMQMFNFRATDVDDLIANTAGAVIGFMIAKLIAGKRIKREQSGLCRQGREVLALCVLTFLINFTIQPLLSEWVWSFIV